MDSELGNRLDDSPKPKRLTTLACSVGFPRGNNFLHQFVLDHSEPNDSCAESCTAGVLLSMSEAPGRVVNALNDDGFGALHLAVQKNNLSIVKKLLSCLANVDVDARCGGGLRPPHGNTALHIAADLGYSSIILELLNKGASTDLINGYQMTALCMAARRAHLDTIELLISKGADVNPENAGTTPLCCAVESGNLAAVELLVSKGASVNPNPRRLRDAPLMCATVTGNMDAVKFLLDKGAGVGGGGGALVCATLSENLAAVEFLVCNGAKIDAEDEWGNTPLGSAASEGNLEIVEYLVANGAGINVKCRYGQTPLHAATSSGKRRLRDIERDGNTPLCKVPMDRNFETVKLLVDNGADLNARDRSNYTPLHHAVVGGKLECATFLIDQGADLHAAGKDGWTPLHKAASSGHVDIVKMLLDRGADSNARTQQGKTPIDIAGQMQNQLCIDVLQNVG